MFCKHELHLPVQFALMFHSSIVLTCRRRLPTPVLPEFKPPQPSDFEPTLSAHLEPTRTRSESEPRETLLPAPPTPSTPPTNQEADPDESKVRIRTYVYVMVEVEPLYV